MSEKGLLLLLEEEDVGSHPMLTLGAPVLLLLGVELFRVNRLGAYYTKSVTFETAKTISAFLARRKLQIELLLLLRQLELFHDLGVELYSPKILNGSCTVRNTFLIAGEELAGTRKDRVSNVPNKGKIIALYGCLRHPIGAIPLIRLIFFYKSLAHGG